MKKESPVFQELNGFDGIYTIQIGKLRCTAFDISGEGICVYSPVANLNKKQLTSLEALGTVTVLLAPNHYHNKGIVEYTELFPKAQPICSTAAKPRLFKITDLKFDNLQTLKLNLPSNIVVLEPEGLKTGEVWIQITKDNDVIWIVTDTFSSKLVPSNKFVEKPTMLGTFPKYGVKDKTLYRAWVEQQISQTRPTILIPCHGSPVASPNLADDLINLIKEYF